MTNTPEDVEDRQLAALDDYLGQVVQCVAWQLARNGDTLPAFFVIPPPTDADQLEAAHDILSDFIVFEFDNAPLPENRHDNGESADERSALECAAAGRSPNEDHVSVHDWSTVGSHVSARPVARHTFLIGGRELATPSLRDNLEVSVRSRSATAAAGPRWATSLKPD